MARKTEKLLSPPANIPDWVEDYLTSFCRVIALGYMSSAIIHEIGNALTVISGNSQIIQIKKAEMEREDILARIDRVVDQVFRIQGVLSRVGSLSSRLAGHKREIDPHISLDNVLYTFHRKCNLAGLELVTDILEDDYTVFFDQSLLEFVLLELFALFLPGFSHLDCRGTINVAAGSDETQWKLESKLTIADKCQEIIERWESLEFERSLAVPLLIIDAVKGQVKVFNAGKSFGWRLTIPRKQGRE